MSSEIKFNTIDNTVTEGSTTGRPFKDVVYLLSVIYFTVLVKSFSVHYQWKLLIHLHNKT